MDVVALAQNGFANAVATLGTACTAEHVQKLFRFTDTVVFSFDGDAAGRRAAGARAGGRAAACQRPAQRCASCSCRPNTIPDSFVREFGPDAFEEQWPSAVPLSRQLIEQASRGRGPGHRRRPRAPAGAGQAAVAGAARRRAARQLLRRHCRAQAQLPARRPGAALWGRRRARRPRARAARRAAHRPRARAATRRPGRTRSLRLLLRHSDWWERAVGEDQACARAAGGTMARSGMAGASVHRAWAQTWAAREAWTDAAWADTARAGSGRGADEEHGFDDLQRVLHRMWIDGAGESACLVERATR